LGQDRLVLPPRVGTNPLPALSAQLLSVAVLASQMIELTVEVRVLVSGDLAIVDLLAGTVVRAHHRHQHRSRSLTRHHGSSVLAAEGRVAQVREGNFHYPTAVIDVMSADSASLVGALF